MPESGHRADLGVSKALALLKQGALGQGRILLVGSSLSEEERQGIRRALGQQSAQLLMLGVGTAEGAPIAQEDGSFLKDEQGAIRVPQLDSPSLGAFLASVGGEYHSARLDETDLHALGLFDGPRSLRNDGQTVRLDTWADQGYWLLLPLLLLAACAGRRGWLFCLPLLLCLPQPSYAFDFEDLWLRPDQQGLHLLKQKRAAEAADHFEDHQWQGVALYEAGDYSGAAQRFAEGSDARAHYNRGNALAKSGELEAAIDAYEQALELQPDLRPAQTNKALVENLLKQKNTPPPAEPQPQTAQPNVPGDEPPPATAQPPAVKSDTPSEAQPGESANQPPPTTPPPPGPNEVPGNPPDETANTAPTLQPGEDNLEGEQRQALEQWLGKIPDNPGELLRRKFWYEQQQHQDQEKTR
jgi:Ca-activated chloride channel family protein